MPSEGSRGVKARFPITGVTSDGLCPDVRVKVVEDAKVHSKAKKRMMIEQTLYLFSYIFLAVNISIIKAWKSVKKIASNLNTNRRCLRRSGTYRYLIHNLPTESHTTE